MTKATITANGRAAKRFRQSGMTIENDIIVGPAGPAERNWERWPFKSKRDPLRQGSIISVHVQTLPRVLTDQLLNAFVTLFVTIDPISLVPLFLAVTADVSTDVRRRIALRAALIATAILMVFLVIGNELLAVLGISLAAFRIAGGLLLFYIAFEMVFAKRSKRRSESTNEAIHEEDHGSLMELAVFPIAVPLTAGPGAISAVILLATDAPSFADRAALGGIIALVMALTLLAYFSAELLDRVMSATVCNVLTRLFGVLLAALSVQFVVDGAIAVLQV